MNSRGRRTIAYIALVILINQWVTPVLEARSSTRSKREKVAVAAALARKEGAREERFKKNIINSPVRCNVVTGGHSEQVIIDFDRALYCEFESKGNFHIIKFPNMALEDFIKLGIKERFAALAGITAVDISSKQDEGIQKVLISITYDPIVADIKFHKPPKAKYIKVDVFSRKSLQSIANDCHLMYQACLDFTGSLTVSPRRLSERIIIDSGTSYSLRGDGSQPVVLGVARLLQKKLKRLGHTAYLAHHEKRTVTMQEKLKRGRQLKGTLLVSLFSEPLFSCKGKESTVIGASFIPLATGASIDTSDTSHEKVSWATGHTTVVAESSLLSRKNYCDSIAANVCEGIEQYLSSSR